MSAIARVLAGLDEAKAGQEELYVHLHQNPELPMQETETVAEITRRLVSFGYDVHQIGGGVVLINHLANPPMPTCSVLRAVAAQRPRQP